MNLMHKRYQKMVYISLLVAFGMVLHVIENLLPVPFPVPGAKLGLANIISLLTIVLYGLREGLIVSILRSLLGTLISGSMSSLIYSLSGAVVSTLAMAFFYRFFSNTFSLAGISIIGGIAHNFTQITVASLILSTSALYVYLPYLMIIGLFTGLFTGLSAMFVKQQISKVPMLSKGTRESNQSGEEKF